MTFTSTNPATGLSNETFPEWTEAELNHVLEAVHLASPSWSARPISERAMFMRGLANTLREQTDSLATIVTEEMGKRLSESKAEVEKCATACEYYAQHSAQFLADEAIESDARDSRVIYQPLGTVLAVMPWNFPLWQVLRFAAPALMAGNTAVLKHASNVPRCALALEALFQQAGFPENVFRSLMISSKQVQTAIEHPAVAAVTLTGSTPAGKAVAAAAGKALKKSVLELGGSDPFIVLADADLDLAVKQGVSSRFMNAGQSCIAAKRFIVVDAIAEHFLARFKTAVEALKMGDPMDPGTQLAPMARTDLRDELHGQVTASIAAGATGLTGCQIPPGNGAYYPASILDHVKPDNPAYREELFGPVAIVIRAKDEADAVAIANDSEFGLGGSVWTTDRNAGERVARQLECGCAFVNGIVKSDPRLPFGGIKTSGYGRELSHQGMREFVNVKTLWMN